MIKRTFPFFLWALLFTATIVAAEGWHLKGWQARAVVEIPKPLSEPGVDTAGVHVLCQGRAKGDGSDYRVLDGAGKPVPFQLMFHDAVHRSLIAFRAVNPGRKFFIYFANPQAKRSAQQVVADPAPGVGPPKGKWIPRQGLVFATIQRPEGKNPKTVEELAKLIAASPAGYGARFQRRISDGWNPFGPSDYYISLYRGWIRIPRAGKYQFCTVSNEASFSFIDGKKLVHWPGRHTSERGARGEKNAAIELSAGPHYIEYYHEEVMLRQMAFLGWRPSPDKGEFSPVPEEIYTAPHAAEVTRYETPAGPLLTFEPEVVDSIWPARRHEGQYTRWRFTVNKAARFPKGTTYHWDFGDGQTATGPEVEHVFLSLGNHQVTLSSKGPNGQQTVGWPLDVYDIQHVTDAIKQGRLTDYVKLVRGYDRSKLEAVRLKELAHLLAEAEQPAEALNVGKEFVKRFGGSHPEMLPRVRRLMADCAIRLGKGGIDEAIANYQASITDQTPLDEKLEVLSRLITLLGIERNAPDKAAEIFAQVEPTVKGAQLDERALAAYRHAVIVAGDVLLWHAKPDQARELYKRAEILSGNPIPSQVRAARVGSYPNAIREYVQAGNHDAALGVIVRWEETFPTEKLNGQTFFWRGKVLHLQGQHKEAARYLARSVGLAVGSFCETEARWLLAESLEQLGRKDDARKELAKLVAAGVDDKFAKMAREKLAQSAASKKSRSAKP